MSASQPSLKHVRKSCIDRIDADPAHAGDYCENVTVRWLYSVDGPAGELFYYDIGLSDGSFFDTLTARMAKYLNRQDVREALHTTTGQRWTQSDETGPVADALLSDWTVNSDAVVEKLLERKLKVRMYNGVRDVSSCNHMGNLAVILQMSWAGKSAFTAAATRRGPHPSVSRATCVPTTGRARPPPFATRLCCARVTWCLRWSPRFIQSFSVCSWPDTPSLLLVVMFVCNDCLTVSSSKH